LRFCIHFLHIQPTKNPESLAGFGVVNFAVGQ